MKYLAVLLALALVSCDPQQGFDREITGYVPVYATQQAATSIAATTPKPTVHAGKIYAWNQYLFQVEQNEGIHIIDNSNPQQAHKISFLTVPGASEISIKSNFLYTNNLNDLVVIDLSTITAPQLVNRLVNAFPQFSQQYPPFSNVYFECPDPSKGVVIAWEEKLIKDPKCRR